MRLWWASLPQVLRGLPKGPTVLMSQEVTPPTNIDVVALNGYMVFFEKRDDLKARTAVPARSGPRIDMGRVQTHELYTEVEVKAADCELIGVVSLYIPHGRSRSDDTAPMQGWAKQTSSSGMSVVAGDLNSTGTYEMQQDINLDITRSDLIGAKACADSRDRGLTLLCAADGRLRDTHAATGLHTRTHVLEDGRETTTGLQHQQGRRHAEVYPRPRRRAQGAGHPHRPRLGGGQGYHSGEVPAPGGTTEHEVHQERRLPYTGHGDHGRLCGGADAVYGVVERDLGRRSYPRQREGVRGERE